MTWAAFKALVEGQKPVWLYEFTIGGTTERYVPRASSYSYGGNSYSPLAITGPDRITDAGQERKAKVEVTMPASAAFAQSILDGIGAQIARVRILNGDAGDPDQEFRVVFSGRVKGFASFAGRTSWGRLKVWAENDFTTGRRRVSPRIIDRTCSYGVYSTGCGLNIADFNAAGTATAIVGNTLTISAASGQADGYYRGGILTYDTHLQLIESHVGDQITLLAPVPGLAAQIASLGSASVEIAPGCDKTATTCNTKFSNVLNFGGWPEMDDELFDGSVLT